MTNVMLDPLTSLLLGSDVPHLPLSKSSNDEKAKLQFEPTTNDARSELSSSSMHTLPDAKKSIKGKQPKKPRRATTGSHEQQQEPLPWTTEPKPWLSPSTTESEPSDKKKQRQQLRSLHLQQQSKQITSSWRRASLPAYLEKPKPILLSSKEGDEAIYVPKYAPATTRASLTTYFDLQRKKQQDEEGVLFSATQASRRASLKWQEKVKRLRQQKKPDKNKNGKPLKKVEQVEKSFYEKITERKKTKEQTILQVIDVFVDAKKKAMVAQAVKEQKRLQKEQLRAERRKEREAEGIRREKRVSFEMVDQQEIKAAKVEATSSSSVPKRVLTEKKKHPAAPTAPTTQKRPSTNRRKRVSDKPRRRSHKKSEKNNDPQLFVPALRELIESEKVRRASLAGSVVPRKPTATKKSRSVSLPEYLLRPESLFPLQEVVEYEMKRRSSLANGKSKEKKAKKANKPKKHARKARSASMPVNVTASKSIRAVKDQRRSLNENWRSETPDFRWEIPGYQQQQQQPEDITPIKSNISDPSQESNNRALHTHRTIPLEATVDEAIPSNVRGEQSLSDGSSGQMSDLSSGDGGEKRQKINDRDDIALTPRDRVKTRPMMALVDLDQVVSYCVQARPTITVDDLCQVVSAKRKSPTATEQKQITESKEVEDIKSVASEESSTGADDVEEVDSASAAVVGSAPDSSSKHLQFSAMPDADAWNRRKKVESEIEEETSAIRDRRNSVILEEKGNAIQGRRNSKWNSLNASFSALRASLLQAATGSADGGKQARLERKLSRCASLPSITTPRDESLSSMDDISQPRMGRRSPVDADDSSHSRKSKYDVALAYICMTFSDEEV